jgi:molybdopterin molybdotransferase
VKEFIPFEEARDIVLRHVTRLEAEDASLDEALGLTLARDVESRDDIPPFDNSAMDGFALRSEDVPKPGVRLPITGVIPAGRGERVTVAAGSCVRIMTGAPLPNGADAVLPIELASVDEDGRSVSFTGAAAPGENVRRAGEDIRRGARVLEAGGIIRPPEIAVLASVGYATVPVTRMPGVSIVTTGDELIDPSEPLRPGMIRDSNGPTLAAQVATAGGRVLGRYRAGDERASVRRTLREAARADLLIVTGGVSVGEYDFVRDELEALGMELLFWRVRQRPGKPIAFGILDDRPVFGLPGNPVSSAVCFEMYVRPALAAMLGRRTVLRPRLAAVLGAEIEKRPGLHYFARGRARWSDGRLVVEPTGPQGSHIASSLVAADGIVHLEETLDGAPAGSVVDFERLEW